MNKMDRSGFKLTPTWTVVYMFYYEHVLFYVMHFITYKHFNIDQSAQSSHDWQSGEAKKNISLDLTTVIIFVSWPMKNLICKDFYKNLIISA